ncbi:MAG: tripartite tricarboxylate transporter substrate binding protein [Proteobacteria bacterium]|nr:tripartite tricarboxylate transporter substrate binding protein [Pseudomonadota bacterium]
MPLATTTGAAAEPRPPVRLIVPSTPGGSGDRVARLVADALAPLVEGPVTVTLLSSQGGVAALNTVAEAPKDGHTLGLVLSTPLVAGRLLTRDAAYNPVEDFDWLAILGRYSNAVVVRANDPAANWAQWLERARRTTRPLRYGSLGVASAGNLAGEFLRTVQHARLAHAEYPTSAAGYAALAAGDIDLFFDGTPSAAARAARGDTRVIAVTGRERDAAFSDAPAFGELWPGQAFEIWFGLAAPRGLPPSIRVPLAAAVGVLLLDRTLPPQFTALGVRYMGLGGADASQFVRDDVVRQAALIARMQIPVVDRR